MVSLTELWLPILLAPCRVRGQLALHMVFHTTRRLRRVPREDDVMAALRLFTSAGRSPVPRPGSMAAMKRLNTWPSGSRGRSSDDGDAAGRQLHGRSLAQWFVYCAVVSLFAAYHEPRAQSRRAVSRVSQMASTTPLSATVSRCGRILFGTGASGRQR